MRDAHDGLHRLIELDRGVLNGNRDALTTAAFGQAWGLGALGKWDAFDQDADGDGTADLAQSRDHNKANEITNITETAGAAWATPGHDRAGNMTTLPKPDTPTATLTGVYDAWHRLVSATKAYRACADDGLGGVSVKNHFDLTHFRSSGNDPGGHVC